MKILKQGVTEIYDYTCEEIIEETCLVCKAVFEYTQSDYKTEIVENEFYSKPLLKSLAWRYITCLVALIK